MMVLRYPYRQRKRGFTLTELAIVLGVIGAILGGIWAATSHVHASQKVQKASGQVIQILNNYRSLYAQHGIDVAAVTDVTCTGVNANFFPSDMANPTACTTGMTATYPIGPFSSSYVEVFADPTVGNNGITIKYAGLTESACNNFTVAAITSPDLVSVNINGTSYTAAPNVTTIEGDCTTAATNYVAATYKAR